MLPSITPDGQAHTDHEERHLRQVLRRDIAGIGWDTRHTSTCLVHVLGAAAAAAFRTDGEAAERQRRRDNLRDEQAALASALERSLSVAEAAEAAIATSKLLISSLSVTAGE